MRLEGCRDTRGQRCGTLQGPAPGRRNCLAQRANLLFTTGVCAYPQRIVAISFKVDAATNLRERVAARCRPAHTARFDSLTFHAFARHIVARHRPHVADRVPPDFRVGPGRSEAGSLRRSAPTGSGGADEGPGRGDHPAAVVLLRVLRRIPGLHRRPVRTASPSFCQRPRTYDGRRRPQAARSCSSPAPSTRP